MIKRENLKQAIDAIAKQDPEVGFALNEMLATGQIDVPSDADPTPADEPCFLFQNRTVPVRLYQYFSDGPQVLEERLLLKYGELVRKHQILSRGNSFNYRLAALDIHQAGLKAAVDYELNLALETSRQRLNRTRERLERGQGKSNRLALEAERREAAVKKLENIASDASSTGLPNDGRDPSVLFRGIVDKDTPAYFVRFPFSRETLMQAADINLDFFYLRFLLNCLISGYDRYLFAAIVNRRLAGLMLLTPVEDLFFADLTIKFIATVRGRKAEPGEISFPVPKGVGTTLVAGSWMYWKFFSPRTKRIILDAELAATRFYKGLGFHRSGNYQYVLRRPSSRLLRNIAVMAEHLPENCGRAFDEILALIKDQKKMLFSSPANPDQAANRSASVDFIKECLKARNHPDLARTAAALLVRHQNSISDAEEMLEFAQTYGLVRPGPGPNPDIAPACVVFDDLYTRHLEKIFHLENPGRIEAARAILQDPAVSGRFASLPPRQAELEELAWVHTPGHIARIAATAGRPLASFDLDTQTSERTWEVARLAVGGVFTLLDEIWEGRIRRGFAFVRPPGHHAEPDKAMGYCFFNNAALGARYLQYRRRAKRIMIIDIDAHHGNGTQAAFYESADVLYFSLHQFPFYPGTGNIGEVGRGAGEGFTVNVPLPKRQDDYIFGQALHFIAAPIAEQFKPEAIIVSCGFDLYIHDPASEMKGTPEGYGIMTSLLTEMADKVCHGRIAFIMEGGYSVKGVRECGLEVMKVLCRTADTDQRKIDRIRNALPSRTPALRKVIEVQGKYWKL